MAYNIGQNTFLNLYHYFNQPLIAVLLEIGSIYKYFKILNINRRLLLQNCRRECLLVCKNTRRDKEADDRVFRNVDKFGVSRVTSMRYISSSIKY